MYLMGLLLKSISHMAIIVVCCILLHNTFMGCMAKGRAPFVVRSWSEHIVLQIQVCFKCLFVK